MPGSSVSPSPSWPTWRGGGSRRGRSTPPPPSSYKVPCRALCRAAAGRLEPMNRVRLEPLVLSLLLVLVAGVGLARGIGLLREPHRMDAHEERQWFEWAYPRS